MLRFAALFVFLGLYGSIVMADDEMMASPGSGKGREILTICPNQAPPEIPQEAIKAGVEGTVRALVKIVDGVVQGVTIVSGPRIYHDSVRAAILNYKCTKSVGIIWGTQEFVFSIK